MTGGATKGFKMWQRGSRSRKSKHIKKNSCKLPIEFKGIHMGIKKNYSDFSNPNQWLILPFLLPSLSLSGRRVPAQPQLHQHGRGGLLPVPQRQLLPVSERSAAAGVPSATRRQEDRGQRDVAVRAAAVPLLGAVLHRQGGQGDDVQGAGRGGARRAGAQLLSRWEEGGQLSDMRDDWSSFLTLSIVFISFIRKTGLRKNMKNK